MEEVSQIIKTEPSEERELMSYLHTPFESLSPIKAKESVRSLQRNEVKVLNVKLEKAR